MSMEGSSVELGFEVVAAQSKKRDLDSQPTQERMKAQQRTPRNPSTDQKKVRRQMARKGSTDSAQESTGAPMRTEAHILAEMAQAPTLEAQRTLAIELEEMRRQASAAARADRELDFSATIVEERYPTMVNSQFTQHTAASDWLDDVVPEAHDTEAVVRQARAEATVWWQGRPQEVLADSFECHAQAHGMAQRFAGQFGLAKDAAYSAYMDTVGHLRSRLDKQAFDEVQKPPYQAPSGSSLPVGVDNKDTWDESMFTPEGPDDPKTESGDSPSLSEGDSPSGDTSGGGVENPAAGNTHAEDSKDTTYTDALQPDWKTPNKGTTSAGLHTATEDPKTDKDWDAPSLQQGTTPEGDHAESYTQGPQTDTVKDQGNGPATDSLDGTQTPYGHDSDGGSGGGSTTKPYAASLALIGTSILSRQVDPRTATFAKGLSALSSVDQDLNGVSGRKIAEYLMGSGDLSASEVEALRTHLNEKDASISTQAGEYQGGSPKEGDTATCHKGDGPIQFFDGQWMHLRKGHTGPSHNDVHPATPREKAEKSSALQVTAARPLYEIADDIRRNWPNVYFGAVPYLDALGSLSSVDDYYGAESGKMIVAYLLSNMRYWRGPEAARLKKELKDIQDGRTASRTAGEVPPQFKEQQKSKGDSGDSEGGQKCQVCGDSIEKDPGNEEPSTWHHDNGEKHDHEAKPASSSKESNLKHAVSLTNIGNTDDPLVFSGKDSSGKTVRFKVTEKEASDLKTVLYSDLAINFSGVDVDESDIVSDSGKTSSSHSRTASVSGGTKSQQALYGNQRLAAFASRVQQGMGNLATSTRTAAEGGKWKAQVAGNGEMVWSGNALTFDTPEEAKAYISDLSMRWFGFDLGRVVPESTPTREPVDLSDPAITHNFRS